MEIKKFEILHSGFDAFHKDVNGVKSTIFVDDFGNTDLLLNQYETGAITITPKGSSAKIEIFDNQIIITQKK